MKKPIIVFLTIVLALIFGQASALNTSLMPLPKVQFADANGKPYSGGKLVTCQPGTTCTLTVNTPKATYTDSIGSGTNTNPVVLDSAGRANVWLSGFYKMALYDVNNVLVWTQDNVSSGSGLGTPYWADIANYTSLNALVAAVGTTPTTVIIYSAYTLAASLVIPSTMTLEFVTGGSISISGGVTLTLPDPDHVQAAIGQNIFTGAGSVSYTSNAGIKSGSWDGISGVSKVGLNTSPDPNFDFKTNSIGANASLTGASPFSATANCQTPDWLMMGGLLKSNISGASAQMIGATPYVTGYIVIDGRNGISIWGEGATAGVSPASVNGMKIHSSFGTGTTGVWSPGGEFNSRLTLKFWQDTAGASVYAVVWSKQGSWYDATNSEIAP